MESNQSNRIVPPRPFLALALAPVLALALALVLAPSHSFLFHASCNPHRHLHLHLHHWQQLNHLGVPHLPEWQFGEYVVGV